MHDTDSKPLSEAGRGDLAALCERALKLALSIPPRAACDALFEQRDAEFLVAARQLCIDLSQADRWSDGDLRRHAHALALAASALALGSAEAVAAQSNSGGAGGAGGSCIDDGVRAFNACLAGCHFPGGGGATIGCAMHCRQAALESIVGCLLRKMGSVFA